MLPEQGDAPHDKPLVKHGLGICLSTYNPGFCPPKHLQLQDPQHTYVMCIAHTYQNMQANMHRLQL